MLAVEPTQPQIQLVLVQQAFLEEIEGTSQCKWLGLDSYAMKSTVICKTLF
jgi:hypothetical protein